MRSLKNHVPSDLLIGLLAGLGMAFLIFLVNYDGRQPYYKTERLVAHRQGEQLVYKATFEKNAWCEFDKLVPFLVTIGVPERTTYQDLEGRGQQDDRLEGLQTLFITVDLKRKTPEKVELRTRHFCGPEKIPLTKTFDIVQMRGF